MTNTNGVITELQIQMPSDHACYADHFPGNPLVPGALLLKWINAAIEQKLNCQLVLLKQIKFLAAVKPNDLLTVILTSGHNTQQLSITVYRNDTQVIKGTMECTFNCTNECTNDCTPEPTHD